KCLGLSCTWPSTVICLQVKKKRDHLTPIHARRPGWLHRRGKLALSFLLSALGAASRSLIVTGTRYGQFPCRFGLQKSNEKRSSLGSGLGHHQPAISCIYCHQISSQRAQLLSRHVDPGQSEGGSTRGLPLPHGDEDDDDDDVSV